MPRLAGCLITEPFEISLTFIRMLGKKSLHWGGRSLGIPNQAALLNLWVSVYWFIWDLFDMFSLRWFPNHFGPRERSLFIYVVLSGIIPLLPQAIPSWSLSCLAWLSSPLSFTPLHRAENLCSFVEQWMQQNMEQHAAMPSYTMADKSFMFSFCSYSTCRVYSFRMRPLCHLS